MRAQANLIGIAALAAALVFPSAVLGGMEAVEDSLGAGLTVRTENGISYVSGGIGDDQQKALKSASDSFNLQVTLASQGGKYLGGADIRITDTQDEDVLSAHADGPLFLAKLPAGNYTVHAEARGKSLSRKVDVPKEGQRQIVMILKSTQAGDTPQ